MSSSPMEIDETNIFENNDEIILPDPLDIMPEPIIPELIIPEPIIPEPIYEPMDIEVQDIEIQDIELQVPMRRSISSPF
jgi:hypothetical protein